MFENRVIKMNAQYLEQLRRETERTLSPLGNATSEANRDRELWRRVLATAFPDADPGVGDVESPIYRVQKLAQAVEKRLTLRQPGKPPTLVLTYEALAKLPDVENWPNAVDWALISFGCALKAMIEMTVLDETDDEPSIPDSVGESEEKTRSRNFDDELSIKSAVDKADIYLNDEIARRYRGILSQDILPEDDRALTKRVQEFAREWRRLPEFRNKSRNDNVALALRAMVEFIAIYSGLFVDSKKRHRSVGDLSLSPSEFFRQNIERCQSDQLCMKENHPMLVPPTPWSNGKRGGHLVAPNHLYKIRSHNAIQADLQHIVDKQDFPIVFEAANVLQNTGWRVNDRVLKTAEQIYHSLSDDVLPEDLASLRKASKSKKSDFEDIALEWQEANRLDQDGFAWRSGIGDLAKQSAFYFPYQLDYRGRLYPLAAWLSPQGDDLSKGLLEFSTGKLVKSPEAWQLLALHGSQCVPTGNISKEIELGSGETPSLVDRESWVRLHERDITACADNPIQNTWWLTTSKAKCRWQFLAFCMAWTSAKQDEPCHLPVCVDGSCNGLQHMAALLRDRSLAKHTNLLLSARPQDTYTWVQRAVESSIGDEAGRQDAIYGNVAQWVQAHQMLDRDAAKKVVMVFSYGSDRYKDHLLEHLKEMEKEKSKKFGNERWWETPGSPACKVDPEFETKV
jgi:DNA-dependent RNA polymerase/DNA-directed RNA polymerase N-terminal